MNGKRARELRKLANNVMKDAELPDKEYEDIITTKVEIVQGKVVKVKRVTVRLKPHCKRSWYKAMKKAAHKEG